MKLFKFMQTTRKILKQKDEQLTTNDPIIDKVIEKHKERSRDGMIRFGVSMDKNNKTEEETLLDIQEELMDGVCYIEKLLQIRK
tara:strand:- start:97 stop:348 length:252 start_codon:yes stop_codon:yes gene_type:complete